MQNTLDFRLELKVTHNSKFKFQVIVQLRDRKHYIVTDIGQHWPLASKLTEAF